jgi:hypothetical protein
VQHLDEALHAIGRLLTALLLGERDLDLHGREDGLRVGDGRHLAERLWGWESAEQSGKRVRAEFGKTKKKPRREYDTESTSADSEIDSVVAKAAPTSSASASATKRRVFDILLEERELAMQTRPVSKNRFGSGGMAAGRGLVSLCS